MCLLRCLKTAGKAEFVSMDIGAWWQEQYILPVKATDLQSQTFQKKKKKHYVSFISSLHKKFDQAFFFLNNKQLSSLAKSL